MAQILQGFSYNPAILFRDHVTIFPKKLATLAYIVLPFECSLDSIRNGNKLIVEQPE